MQQLFLFTHPMSLSIISFSTGHVLQFLFCNVDHIKQALGALGNQFSSIESRKTAAVVHPLKNQEIYISQ